MKYKVLVLKNSPNIDVKDECEKATQFFATRSNPIQVEFTVKEINIPVEYKVYKTVQGFNSETGKPMLVDYYGLVDSVKDSLKSVVKEFEYNSVLFINDISNIPVIPGRSYPNWTNFKPLYFNTGFIQVVFTPHLKKTGNTDNAIKHELMHDFCFTLNRYGYPVLDEMDIDHLGRPYYRNDFPTEEDSNFGFTFKNIKPYLDKLVPQSKKIENSFTKDKFMKFYKGTPNEASASLAYDAISKALADLGILTDLTLIGALATVRVEVGRGFKPIEEYASGAAYEGRRDLGNYVPGDGVKYKGRGFIQLTGRANYEKYGKKFNMDLICHPELALGVDISAKVLAQYFKDRGCNIACDAKDWVRVRKLVNGGSNGLTDFLNIINQYLSL